MSGLHAEMTAGGARAAILRGDAPTGLSVGGWLYLSGCTGLTALPEGLSVTGWLDLNGCTGLSALPKGLSVGGWLDLSGCTRLTALPDGLSVGKWLCLKRCTSLTALPDGLSVGGALDLSGCTSLTALPNLSGVSGRVWLPDHLCAGNVCKIDGQTTIVGSWRKLGDEARIARAKWFGGGRYQSPSLYVAQVGEHYAHGYTIDEAIRDARMKAVLCPNRDDLIAQITETELVTYDQFRALTGACNAGLRDGLAARGYETAPDALPLSVVREIGAGDRFVEEFLQQIDEVEA